MLKLELIFKSDRSLKERMLLHYSQPKGFVGRNLCYEITWDDLYLGNIVSGSSTRWLPGRDEYLGLDDKNIFLSNIINNVFYSISPIAISKYPYRNFTSDVLKNWREKTKEDWEKYYGDKVIGFEALVQVPRTGDLYKKDGWKEVGITKGYTCKRVGGIGTDSYSGKRVWDTVNLKPKRVFCKKI